MYSQHGEERRWQLGDDAPGNELVRLTGVAVERGPDTDLLTVADTFRIRVHYHNVGITDDDMNISIHVYNGEDILVFTSGWREEGKTTGAVHMGEGSVWCEVPGNLLNVGDYRIVVNFFRNSKLLFQVEDTIGFEVQDTKREGSWYGRRSGVFRPRLRWGAN
jgi:hypothetical protein